MNEEYFADNEPKKEVSDEEIKRVSDIGIRMVKLGLHIIHLELTLEQKKKEYLALERDELPEAMDKIGMASFRLTSGHEIKVVPVMKVSYLKDAINEVEEWLRKNGHSGLVKRELKVVIPREDDPEKASPIVEAIKQAGYDVLDAKNIHYQTLQKWAKEMDESGELIPEVLFNVYRGRIAKVIT